MIFIQLFIGIKSFDMYSKEIIEGVPEMPTIRRNVFNFIRYQIIFTFHYILY